nr:heterokaryon incompatibility protein 6, or allele [Quercus suber]
MLGKARANSWPKARDETRRIRKAEAGDSILGSPKGTYTRLAIGELRLLVLFPGVDNEPLRAELRVVSFASAPVYRAVSYRWGSPTRTRRLILDGQIVDITESLFAALRASRMPHQSHFLWADAICINQENEDEKGCQLNLMASIYRNAEFVFVYLGEHRPEFTLACWTIIWLHRHWVTLPGSSRADNFSRAAFLQSFQHYLLGQGDDLKCVCLAKVFQFQWKTESSSERLHEALRAVNSLLDSAWFGRLWTLQENAVAECSVFQYGQHRITWPLIAHAIQVCEGYAHCESLFTVRERNVFLRAAHIEHVVAQYFQSVNAAGSAKSTQSLLSTMINTWSLESSCAKDRLNSVKALAFVELEADLQLNQNLHISVFWFRVACFILTAKCAWKRPKWHGDHICPSFVLTLAGFQHSLNDPLLPSWVPDMGKLNKRSEDKYFSTIYSHDIHRAGGGARFFRVDVKTDPGTLYVHGIQVSHIVDTLPGTQYRSSTIGCESDETRTWDVVDPFPLTYFRPSATLWDEGDCGGDGENENTSSLAIKAVPEQPEIGSLHPRLSGSAAWEGQYWREVQEWLFPWYMYCYDLVHDRVNNFTNGEYKTNDFSTLITQGCIFDLPMFREAMRDIPQRREAILKRASEWLGDLPEDRGLGALSTPSPEQFYEDMKMYLHPQLYSANLLIDETRILAHFSDGRVGWVPEHAQEGDVVYLLKGAPDPYILRRDKDGLYSDTGAPLYTLVGDAYVLGIMNGQAWPSDVKMTNDDVIGLI